MNKLSKITLKTLLPALVFLIFLTPVITSSLLDLEQKKINKEIWEQQERIYLLGKFDPKEDERFLKIPEKYNISGYQTYLRKETLNAFLEMAQAAEADGIDLKIASATRNFNYQRDLWNKKWTGYTLVDGKDLSESMSDGKERFEKILEYSAVPGASRHHWGTEIDLNNANVEYFNTKYGKEVYVWLTENAPSFGFCQVYTLKGQDRPTGYNEEKWHWSYLPLSREFTKEYKELLKNEDIQGFEGDEYVIPHDVVSNYVLSINPECL